MAAELHRTRTGSRQAQAAPPGRFASEHERRRRFVAARLQFMESQDSDDFRQDVLESLEELHSLVNGRADEERWAEQYAVAEEARCEIAKHLEAIKQIVAEARIESRPQVRVALERQRAATDDDGLQAFLAHIGAT